MGHREEALGQTPRAAECSGQASATFCLLVSAGPGPSLPRGCPVTSSALPPFWPSVLCGQEQVVRPHTDTSQSVGALSQAQGDGVHFLLPPTGEAAPHTHKL